MVSLSGIFGALHSGQARTKGYSAQEIEERFRGELADVLCHALLLARHNGIDLEEAVERKWLVWKLDPAIAAAMRPSERPGPV